MKKILLVFLFISSTVHAYNTVFNPFTGKLDYVGVSSGSLPSGSSQYIQNTANPTTSTQQFSVSSATIGGLNFQPAIPGVFGTNCGQYTNGFLTLGNSSASCFNPGFTVYNSVGDNISFLASGLGLTGALTITFPDSSIQSTAFAGYASTKTWTGNNIFNTVQITSNTIISGTTFYQSGLSVINGPVVISTGSGLSPTEFLQVNGNVVLGQSNNGFVYPYLPVTTDNPLTSGATVINVNTTLGMPTLGSIIIGTEIIDCSSITATSFVNCTRGIRNTIAASHPISSQVASDLLTITPNPVLGSAVHFTNLGNGSNLSSAMAIGVNRVPGGTLDVLGDGTNIGDLLFRVGSLQQGSQFTITERSAPGFSFGVVGGQLNLGLAASPHSIYDSQSNSNKITLWDSSANGTWTANGNIQLSASPVLITSNTVLSGTTFYNDGSVATSAATTAQALCLTTSNILGHCTSVVGIGGGCTCVAR